MKYYTNGINEIRVSEESQVPNGWYPGRVKSTVTTKGKKWYTNGVENLFLNPTDSVPDGFTPGRSINQEWQNNISKGWKDNKHIYCNNGVQMFTVQCEEDIPQGYVLGKLPLSEAHKESLSESHKGLKHTQQTKEKISKHSNNNRAKAFNTLQEKYGSVKEFYSYMHAKGNNTKLSNGTFNTSKPEIEMYERFCEQYGKENVLRHYKNDIYPYYCDFYIKPIDKYIELNAHWTHGGKPYDPNDEECQKQLEIWQEKAKTSKFYQNAIETWTIRDVAKLRCALEKEINYEVIY